MQSTIDLQRAANLLLTPLAGYYPQSPLFVSVGKDTSRIIYRSRLEVEHSCSVLAWLYNCGCYPVNFSFTYRKRHVRVVSSRNGIKYLQGLKQLHIKFRVLGKLGLESTPINTKGYETLLGLVRHRINSLYFFFLTKNSLLECQVFQKLVNEALIIIIDIFTMTLWMMRALSAVSIPIFSFFYSIFDLDTCLWIVLSS